MVKTIAPNIAFHIPKNTNILECFFGKRFWKSGNLAERLFLADSRTQIGKSQKKMINGIAIDSNSPRDRPVGHPCLRRYTIFELLPIYISKNTQGQLFLLAFEVQNIDKIRQNHEYLHIILVKNANNLCNCSIIYLLLIRTKCPIHNHEYTQKKSVKKPPNDDTLMLIFKKVIFRLNHLRFRRLGGLPGIVRKERKDGCGIFCKSVWLLQSSDPKRLPSIVCLFPNDSRQKRFNKQMPNFIPTKV
ncbi:hypothetical protein AGLY_011097 [Aphis glycines]|uniref:Uncharacterized protein n=1 Tax=Aphis glycines TaxID=307491 RepID=A0A6G0TDE0_APHGL|nr:hypothetical protein AGLY_011097 [Aphis glycines]